MVEAATSPSSAEDRYVAAMSRLSVVSAYFRWKDLSDAERVCLGRYVDAQSRVLDLGCGAGRMVSALEIHPECYLGIDRSSAMVRAARLLHPEHTFRDEDFLSIGNEDVRFDVVLLMNNVLDMLHPFQRRADALRLAHRILDRPGILICSSHLTQQQQSSGYHAEDYHGEDVLCYRSSFFQFTAEVEAEQFDVLLAMRDFRAGVADWLYVVAQPRGV